MKKKKKTGGRCLWGKDTDRKRTEERRDIEEEKNKRQGVMTHIHNEDRSKRQKRKMKGWSTEKKKTKGRTEGESE